MKKVYNINYMKGCEDLKQNIKKYKINKKPLIIVLTISFVLALLLTGRSYIDYGFKYIYLNTWKEYEFKDYDLEFSLLRAYKTVEKEENTTYKIGSSILSTIVDVSGDKFNQLARPQRIFSGGNIYTGINIAINCLKTSKTTKPLEEVTESYCLMIPYFYEDDYETGECVTENLSREDADIIQISCDLVDDENNKTIVMYLMSFEDKEVTVTFFGNTEKVNSEMKNLQEIISKIK